MARDLRIVRDARLSFQRLVAKQSPEFVYASAVNRNSKNGRQLQPAIIAGAAKTANCGDQLF
jgi:hypothetical protein